LQSTEYAVLVLCTLIWRIEALVQPPATTSFLTASFAAHSFLAFTLRGHPPTAGLAERPVTVTMTHVFDEEIEAQVPSVSHLLVVVGKR
jgi:hypothetical protein